MMKKTVLLGILIIVLAVGTVGFAFATDLEFLNGVGALSTGTEDVPQANVHEIRWGLEYDADLGNGGPYVSFVRLSFDRWLAKGTGIGIALFDENDVLIHNSFRQTDAALSGYTHQMFQLNDKVIVEDIYKINVTVGEPRPYKN